MILTSVFFFFLQYEALLVNVGFRAVPHNRSHMDSVVKVRETNGLLSLDTCQLKGMQHRHEDVCTYMYRIIKPCLSLYVCVSVCLSVCVSAQSFKSTAPIEVASVSLMNLQAQ